MSDWLRFYANRLPLRTVLDRAYEYSDDGRQTIYHYDVLDCGHVTGIESRPACRRRCWQCGPKEVPHA